MKKREPSRGVSFVVALAFMIVLGVVAVAVSPSTGNVVSDNTESAFRLSTKTFCSGSCEQRYLFNGQERMTECTFTNNRIPSCSCDTPGISQGAFSLSDPTCSVTYHD